MAVDIRWFGLIEKYLIDGDIAELENLIREGGVPGEFGNQIADILTGKLKPLSPSKTLKMKRETKARRLLKLAEIEKKRGSFHWKAHELLISCNINSIPPTKLFSKRNIAKAVFGLHDEHAYTKLKRIK